MSAIKSIKLLLLSAILSAGLELTCSLDNGLARTPPMGWINWERFTCQTDCENYPNDCVSERLFKSMVDRLVEDGYLEAGYEYVNIDDCWSELARDDAGKLVPDRRRFPGGLETLSKYAHDKKVKLGTYGDCGTKTCAGYPAQLKTETELGNNYFVSDAQLLADWQIDSFKFDGCNLDPAKAQEICPKMAVALNSTERPIMLICEWPFYMLKKSLRVDYALAQKACNAWRYFDDVEDSWLSVLSIVDFTIRLQREIVQYHGPGNWFDPDQLVIGNFALSLDQARAQMAIWSIWSAPLYMSNDLRAIEPEMAAVLKNEKLIAIDQDRLGVLGVLVNQTDGINHQAFVKPIEPIKNGCPSFAIVYLNRHTLGNKNLISFPLRNLLHGTALIKAEERTGQLGGERFKASECRKRLLTAMTRQPIPAEILVNQKEVPMEEQVVTYQVEDLFGDDRDFKQITLNSDLSLMVNPSGVRAIKLVEK